MILGSGGWIPTSTRETCSALLRDGPNLLLIDAGTGLQRLLERPDLVAGAEDVQIVLTHFHLDHVIGLSYLPALALRQPPVIWGPGALFTGIPTRDILHRLLGPPLFSASIESMAREVRELATGVSEIAGFSLETRAQHRHTEPTLALRVGDALTYCTDTAPDPETVAFARGSHVLLHEAWYADDSHDDEYHSAAGDVGRIAHAADVENLVLIHVHPLLNDDQSLAEGARRHFERAVVGVDLATIPLP